MATLTAIADSPNLAGAIQRAGESRRRAAEESNRNADLAAALELPSLRRNGDSKTTKVLVRGPASPTEFTVRFEKLGAGVVGVEITRVALGTGSTVAFNIHLAPNGKIRGFDTDRSGQIDSIQPPNLGFIGPGAIVQFEFDDTALGTLDFGQFSFSSQFLEVLQGEGAVPGPTNTIQGTAGNDVLSGTEAFDTINGLAGNDTITGLARNDIIDGGTGNDTIDGGIGDDTVTGGAHADTLTGAAGSDAFVWNDGELFAVTAAAAGTDSFNNSSFWSISFDTGGAGDFIESVVITLPAGTNFDPSGGGSFGPVFNTGSGLVSGDVAFVVVDGSDTLTINFDPGTFAAGESFSFGIDTDPGTQGANDVVGASFAVTLEDATTASASFASTGTDASAATAKLVDTITDFTVGSEGDTLDFSNLLSGFTKDVSLLSEFVQVTDDGADTTVAIDADGGGNNYVDAVVLTGVVADLNGLLSNIQPTGGP